MGTTLAVKLDCKLLLEQKVMLKSTRVHTFGLGRLVCRPALPVKLLTSCC